MTPRIMVLTMMALGLICLASAASYQMELNMFKQLDEDVEGLEQTSPISGAMTRHASVDPVGHSLEEEPLVESISALSATAMALISMIFPMTTKKKGDENIGMAFLHGGSAVTNEMSFTEYTAGTQLSIIQIQNHFSGHITMKSPIDNRVIKVGPYEHFVLEFPLAMGYLPPGTVPVDLTLTDKYKCCKTGWSATKSKLALVFSHGSSECPDYKEVKLETHADAETGGLDGIIDTVTTDSHVCPDQDGLEEQVVNGHLYKFTPVQEENKKYCQCERKGAEEASTPKCKYLDETFSLLLRVNSDYKANYEIGYKSDYGRSRNGCPRIYKRMHNMIKRSDLTGIITEPSSMCEEEAVVADEGYSARLQQSKFKGLIELLLGKGKTPSLYRAMPFGSPLKQVEDCILSADKENNPGAASSAFEDKAKYFEWPQPSICPKYDFHKWVDTALTSIRGDPVLRAHHYMSTTNNYMLMISNEDQKQWHDQTKQEFNDNLAAITAVLFGNQVTGTEALGALICTFANVKYSKDHVAKIVELLGRVADPFGFFDTTKETGAEGETDTKKEYKVTKKDHIPYPKPFPYSAIENSAKHSTEHGEFTEGEIPGPFAEHGESTEFDEEVLSERY